MAFIFVSTSLYVTHFGSSRFTLDNNNSNVIETFTLNNSNNSVIQFLKGQEFRLSFFDFFGNSDELVDLV